MQEMHQQMIEILLRVRKHVSNPSSNLLWTRWNDANEAVQELDELISELRAGVDPKFVSGVFAPTGSFQEHSISNGWSDEFIALSVVMDRIMCEHASNS